LARRRAHESTRTQRGVDLLAVRADRRTVDQHVLHAGRVVSGEALAVGREVTHPADRSGRHGVGVEHDDIGTHTGPQVTAVGQAEHVGLRAREFADRHLEGDRLATPHPVAQQVGGLRRVAQLTRVRAGVGEPEGAVLVGPDGMLMGESNVDKPRSTVGAACWNDRSK